MEVRTINDLEKYCHMCFRQECCCLLNDNKSKIETCLIRNGIETGYKKAIDDIKGLLEKLPK